ncbi:MAG: hypothetical protein ACRDP1_08820 [Nocardioidaceae bacterium]
MSVRPFVHATALGRNGGAEALGAYAPLCSATAFALVAVLASGTPVLAVVCYFAYWVGGVVVPGVLIHRRLLGLSESLLADVAWGAVTGLLLELVSWSTLTALQINAFLWAPPVGVILLFASTRRLRSMWRRPTGAARTPLFLNWGVACAAVLGTTSVWLGSFTQNHLPPTGDPYYVDLPTILMRTWILPSMFVAIAATACLAVHVTRRPLAGAMAALITVATTSGIAFWPSVSLSVNVLDPNSPSLLYSVGFSCLLVRLLIEVVRDSPMTVTRGSLLMCVALASAGAKSSILPDVLGGLALFLGFERAPAPETT